MKNYVDARCTTDSKGNYECIKIPRQVYTVVWKNGLKLVTIWVDV